MSDFATMIVVVLAALIALVGFFAVLRIFTIEKHMARLVHIAEHQAGLESNEVFVPKTK
ncbi:MAG: hypothetical protein ACLP56_02570 [Candidatus Sulfotelmatobacter sp.]